MKKLKDILYDMNDILVALVIIALAAFVIVGRIDSILAYPSTLTAQVETEEDSDVPPSYQTPDQSNAGDSDSDDTDSNNGDPSDSDNDSGEEDKPDQPSSGNGTNSNEGQGSKGQGSNDQGSSGADTGNISVTIEPGSTASKIADVLIGKGLFENRQQFYDAVAAASADTKLKAGTFTIPSNATPAEVVTILTK
ncbi:hypothetical protein [Sinanaerobacter chloroacetimidivorans]|uniref:Endolytic transglycosylase MltG n=1 Tax=Sinanaerobacter chloroacetimidivorans TaxID=2818044 RepID=A0A8J7W2F2_9FIRM|nr:hypothetical protein [Sinanaerobacter chloroacetimidivorans]MBR0597635.1 endolytic transglycosylase MltG [Sinanaerobacter chloroacetimidivorans]